MGAGRADARRSDRERGERRGRRERAALGRGIRRGGRRDAHRAVSATAAAPTLGRVPAKRWDRWRASGPGRLVRHRRLASSVQACGRNLGVDRASRWTVSWNSVDDFSSNRDSPGSAQCDPTGRAGLAATLAVLGRSSIDLHLSGNRRATLPA